MTDRASTRWAIVAIAAAAVAVCYGRSLGFDLFWDDYGSLHPRAMADLLRVWHGAWDAGPPFYRPLAVWYFSALFDLFGINAWPMHAISLVELTIVASLAGVFVLRASASRAAGIAAALLAVLAPSVAFATGPWITNQFHLLVQVCALAALLAWQRRRTDATLAAWRPIFAWITVAFLIKEDALMLLPALLLAQWLRARWLQDAAMPSRPLIVMTLLTVAALIGVRAYFLAGMGRYWSLEPDPVVVVRDLVRGPLRTLVLFPYTGAFSVIASAVQGAVLVGGAIAGIARRSRAAAGLAILGGSIVLCADAPLALASNLSRYHLLVLGEVMLVAAGAAALVDAVRARPGRIAALAVIASAGFGAMLAANSASQDLYRPCSPSNLTSDLDVVPWELTAPDESAWLANKPRRCNAGTFRPIADSIDRVVWNEASGQATALLTRTATDAALTLRVPDASVDHPAAVSVEVNGRLVLRLNVVAPLTIGPNMALPRTWRVWLRRMHRIDVTADGGRAVRIADVTYR